jgi:hypothetical protein
MNKRWDGWEQVECKPSQAKRHAGLQTFLLQQIKITPSPFFLSFPSNKYLVD